VDATRAAELIIGLLPRDTPSTGVANGKNPMIAAEGMTGAAAGATVHAS
jgi:hypothetical protein